MSAAYEQLAWDGLQQLEATTARDQLDSLAQRAAAEGWSYTQFLGRLLEPELAARRRRQVETTLKFAGLPWIKRLSDFDFAFQPAIERSRIETLATCAFIRAAETVLIQGPPGVGKSHLAVGLGVKAIEHGFSAQFYRFDELKIALKTDAHLPPARLRRRKYLSTSLLIIDELGFEPMCREEASLFFRLVAYRYGRGSILITTNKSVREWTELLAGDEALTTAILDRLLHKAHVLNIKGRSYRLRDLEQTLGTVRS
jgi:DNA replication protein DnaC